MIDGQKSGTPEKSRATDPACKHVGELRGSLTPGNPGAFCVRCRARVKCPHPQRARETVLISLENVVTRCMWCAEEV
jgi:hypothetical protein